MNRRAGLTLLELVVVLAILAVLTLVAVVSTDSVVDQGRYDVTQRTLQNIDDAVIGPAGQPDAVSFVGDVGRTPKVFGAAPELQLAELWTNANSVRLFQAVSVADGDIRLFSGWRGPYLRLPAGQASLKDGWGEPFSLLRADLITASAANDPVDQVVSLGGPVPPYNVPQSLPLALGTSGVGQVKGTITITTTASTVPATLVVKLYRPNGDDPTGATILGPDSALSFTTASSTTAGSTTTTIFTASYVFSNIPAAPVAVRIYKDFTDPNAGQRSTPVYIRVPPRGTVVRDLAMTITP